MEAQKHILQARNDLDEMVLPFWRQNMMYRESLAMIRRENGEITAKLLFRPRKILEVRNNALDHVLQDVILPANHRGVAGFRSSKAEVDCGIRNSIFYQKRFGRTRF